MNFLKGKEKKLKTFPIHSTNCVTRFRKDLIVKSHFKTFIEDKKMKEKLTANLATLPMPNQPVDQGLSLIHISEPTRPY